MYLPSGIIGIVHLSEMSDFHSRAFASASADEDDRAIQARVRAAGLLLPRNMYEIGQRVLVVVMDIRRETDRKEQSTFSQVTVSMRPSLLCVGLTLSKVFSSMVCNDNDSVPSSCYFISIRLTFGLYFSHQSAKADFLTFGSFLSFYFSLSVGILVCGSVRYHNIIVVVVIACLFVCLLLSFVFIEQFLPCTVSSIEEHGVVFDVGIQGCSGFLRVSDSVGMLT